MRSRIIQNSNSECGRPNEVSEYRIRDFTYRKTDVVGGIKKINFLELGLGMPSR